MQVPADPAHAASVSMGSYELCSVDSEGLALLVASMLSGSPTPASSSTGCLALGRGRWEEGLIQKSHLELCVLKSPSVCVMSGCGSLYLFSSAAGGSIFCDV